VWISCYEYAANDSTRYARFRKRQEEDATENERAHSVGATEVCSRGGRICDAEVFGLVCFLSVSLRFCLSQLSGEFIALRYLRYDFRSQDEKIAEESSRCR
jgi:hypothetical protein